MRVAASSRLPAALAAALVLSTPSYAQKKDSAPASIELSGALADANGPLAGKLVRAGPVDSKGNVLNIRGLSGPSAGQGLNPQSTTDAQGRFTVMVARTLFRGYPDDQVGLSAYTDLGGGRLSTSHESKVVRIDPKKDRIDAGRVVLEPLKSRR